MNPMVQVPNVEPLPLPAPMWLLISLLLLVFTLHVLFMNAAFGGGLWAVWNYVRGRSAEHPYSRRLAKEIASSLPVMLAFTITLGVAVLLFAQVLYGQFLYASSILIGAVWICVIPLVILAYYGYYYVSYTAENGKLQVAVVGVFSVLCLATIAFIFSNNMTLMLRPDRWMEMYRAHPNGFNLNLGESALYPRYLHMVVGAIAVFSAMLAHIGMTRMKTDFNYGRWLVRRGASAFAVAAAVQFLIGMWLLLAQPREVIMALLRDPVAGAVFGFALLAVVAAVVLITVGAMSERPSGLVHAGFGVMVVTLVLMVGIRHLLRQTYLKPYLQFDQMMVVPQTGIIVTFFVSFIAGLATIGYMLAKIGKKQLKTDNSGAENAPV